MLSRQLIGRSVTWLQARMLLINTRRSKFTFFGGMVVLCLLYFGSSYLLPAHKRFTSHKHFETCLDRHLLHWESEIASGDIVVKHGSQHFLDINFLALSGNGHVGVTFSDNGITASLLSNTSHESYDIPFPQHLSANVDGLNFDGHEAVTINLKAGSIHQLKSLQSSAGCVIVEHVVFAHRARTNVILQKMVISNYGKSALKATVHQVMKASKKFKVERQKSTSTDEEAKEYVIVSGREQRGKSAVRFVSISSDMEKHANVAAFTSVSIAQTMLLRAEFIKDSPDDDSRNGNMDDAKEAENYETAAKEMYSKLVNQNKALMLEHVNAMERVWSQRINVESKNDPNTPSALHVYLMEYYLGATVQFNAVRSKSDDINGKTGSCYSGAVTMHMSDLWVVPTTMQKLMQMKTKWFQQLSGEGGCSQLLTAGFSGLQEAVGLSFSGLKFTSQSLELAINPYSLSSNVSLLHLYSFDHYLNIKIEVSPMDLHHVIRVQVDGSAVSTLCACSAGCKSIVELQNVYMAFPVLVTVPVTPILYISRNRSDLEVIQKTTFMMKASHGLLKQNSHEPARDHFKLSPKFWIAISLLIIGFHIIVVKMIYNECRKEKGRRPGGRSFNS